MKKQYIQEIKQCPREAPLASLPRKKRGRPLSIGDNLNCMMQAYIYRLREAAGVVNVPIVMAAACGIAAHENRVFLSDFGKPFTPTRDWAHGVLDRMDFTKRKGTKAAKHKISDLPEIKQNFVSRFLDFVINRQIPTEMVVNLDQTGVRMVPSGQWTFEKKGSQHVSSIGLDDKREIKVLLGCCQYGRRSTTWSGDLPGYN